MVKPEEQITTQFLDKSLKKKHLAGNLVCLNKFLICDFFYKAESYK